MKSFEEIKKSVVLVMTVYVGGGGAGGEVTTVQAYSGQSCLRCDGPTFSQPPPQTSIVNLKGTLGQCCVVYTQ